MRCVQYSAMFWLKIIGFKAITAPSHDSPLITVEPEARSDTVFDLPIFRVHTFLRFLIVLHKLVIRVLHSHKTTTKE